MNNSDDLTQIRRRLADLTQSANQIAGRTTTPEKVYIGRVYGGGAIPTTGNKYYLTRPISILGAECEGCTPTIRVDTDSSVAVLSLDGQFVADDYVVASQVNGRWVAEKGQGSGGGGAPTGSFPGCICATPPLTLTMTATANPCNNGLLNSCTIAYGATPASLSSLLGANCYLSTTTFTDSQTGDAYYYYLGCFAAVMRISRVFPTSVFGSPFLDSVIYYWTVGSSGNTCSPFSLTSGTIYTGGDPACVVTITE